MTFDDIRFERLANDPGGLGWRVLFIVFVPFCMAYSLVVIGGKVLRAARSKRKPESGRAIYEKRADVQLKLVACVAFIDPESRPLLARSWPNLPSTDFFYVAWG